MSESNQLGMSQLSLERRDRPQRWLSSSDIRIKYKGGEMLHFLVGAALFWAAMRSRRRRLSVYR